MEMWGTLEQDTAETSWAPTLMIPACSALVPTMNPVTLCRKMIGIFLESQTGLEVTTKEGLARTYSWLQRRMNWAVFAASLGLMMETWFATIPTLNPRINISQTILIPLSGSWWYTHNVRPSSQHVGSVAGLKNGQPGVVHKAQKHLLHIKRLANVRIDDGEQVLCRISWLQSRRNATAAWDPWLEGCRPETCLVNRIKSNI